METARHDHCIAVTHDPDKLGLVGVGVNELHTERRRRHVVIDVQLFQDRRVLVRWPTGPMSRLGSSKARENATGFDILAQHYVDGAGVRWTTRLESKRTIFFHIGEAHYL